MPLPEWTFERFFASLSPGANGCWLWTGYRNRDGYGRLKVARRMTLAHRLSYALVHGPIPSGKLVCHHCDTPACARPDHLFLGTDRDNAADKIRKGRQFTILNPATVARLRRAAIRFRRHGTVARLARATGLSYGTVYSAVVGLSWKRLHPVSPTTDSK